MRGTGIDNQKSEMAINKAVDTIKTCLLICDDDQNAVGKLKRSISELLQKDDQKN